MLWERSLGLVTQTAMGYSRLDRTLDPLIKISSEQTIARRAARPRPIIKSTS